MYPEKIRPESHKFVFICGLHRSGTTLVHEILRDQPDVSGFQNTGVPMDEGQHLQTVFPPASDFGGPGRFGFQTDAHMTEEHPSVSESHKKQLLEEWSKFWNMEKPILLEKSPPNIVRTRFLQALFPNAYFIVLMRHPVVVSLATQKWSKTSWGNLLQHWIRTHETFNNDLPHLRNVCVINYEALIQDSDTILNRVGEFLGIEVSTDLSLSDQNKKYFDQWNARSLDNVLRRPWLTIHYEGDIRRFGYSLKDLGLFPGNKSTPVGVTPG